MKKQSNDADRYEVLDLRRSWKQVRRILMKNRLRRIFEKCAERQFVQAPETREFWEEHDREPWALGLESPHNLKAWGGRPTIRDINFWRPLGSCQFIADWQLEAARKLMPQRDWSVVVSPFHATPVTNDKRRGARHVFDLLWGPCMDRLQTKDLMYQHLTNPLFSRTVDAETWAQQEGIDTDPEKLRAAYRQMNGVKECGT